MKRYALENFCPAAVPTLCPQRWDIFRLAKDQKEPPRWAGMLSTKR